LFSNKSRFSWQKSGAFCENIHSAIASIPFTSIGSLWLRLRPIPKFSQLLNFNWKRTSFKRNSRVSEWVENAVGWGVPSKYLAYFSAPLRTIPVFQLPFKFSFILGFSSSILFTHFFQAAKFEKLSDRRASQNWCWSCWRLRCHSNICIICIIHPGRHIYIYPHLEL